MKEIIITFVILFFFKSNIEHVICHVLVYVLCMKSYRSFVKLSKKYLKKNE